MDKSNTTVETKILSAEDILEMFNDEQQLKVQIIFPGSGGQFEFSPVVGVFVVDPPSRNWFLAIETPLETIEIGLDSPRRFKCQVVA